MRADLSIRYPGSRLGNNSSPQWLNWQVPRLTAVSKVPQQRDIRLDKSVNNRAKVFQEIKFWAVTCHCLCAFSIGVWIPCMISLSSKIWSRGQIPGGTYLFLPVFFNVYWRMRVSRSRDTEWGIFEQRFQGFKRLWCSTKVIWVCLLWYVILLSKWQPQYPVNSQANRTIIRSIIPVCITAVIRITHWFIPPLAFGVVQPSSSEVSGIGPSQTMPFVYFSLLHGPMIKQPSSVKS